MNKTINIYPKFSILVSTTNAKQDNLAKLSDQLLSFHIKSKENPHLLLSFITYPQTNQESTVQNTPLNPQITVCSMCYVDTTRRSWHPPSWRYNLHRDSEPRHDVLGHTEYGVDFLEACLPKQRQPSQTKECVVEINHVSWPVCEASSLRVLVEEALH